MKKVIVISFLLLIVALAVSLFFNYKQYRDAQNVPVVSVDTKVEWRETASEAPQPAFEREVGSITVKVKKQPQTDKKEEIDNPKDTTGTSEPPDSLLEITLPKAQRVYEDSCYTAYVSGYQPKLDSIRLRFPVINTTITKQKEKTTYRRVSIGIIGGYGYGFKSRQVEPFIGLGISVNLW